VWLPHVVGRWQFAKRSFEDVRSQAGAWERGSTSITSRGQRYLSRPCFPISAIRTLMAFSSRLSATRVAVEV